MDIHGEIWLKSFYKSLNRSNGYEFISNEYKSFKGVNVYHKSLKGIQTILNNKVTLDVEKDVTDLVLRDRNHPAVILYSVGNEIRDNLDSPEGFKKYKDLQDLISEVQEEVENYLTELDPSLHLIFIHKGGVKGKALLEKIKKLKPEIILCEAMKKESDKSSFVAQEFERQGRKISAAAISALVDATGSDTRELAAACSQIAFDTSAAKAVIDEEESVTESVRI